MLEKQLLAIVAVIKKIQLKLKDDNNSITDINKLLETIKKDINRIDNKETFKVDEIKDSINTIEKQLQDYGKELNNTESKCIKNIESLSTSLKTSLDGIQENIIKYITNDDLSKFKQEIERQISKIDTGKEIKELNIKIGNVKTIQAGDEASVEVRKTKDSYVLDFYIPRGVSGRGMPGKGVPSGGTTNQVLVKNSDDDYDTKWTTGGTGTQIQSDWNQTDTEEVDYIKNKPTIPDPYTLPTASTTVKGGVKVDGSTITITDEVISAVTGGSGDVTGPTGATDNNIAVFDGVSGKIIKDGGSTIAAITGAIPTNISDLVNDTLVIGTDVQAHDSKLDSIAGLTPGVEGKMITSDGLGGYQISTPNDVRSYLNVEDGAEANNISDTNATDLTDGGATTLHKHSYNNLDDLPTIPDEASEISVAILGTPTYTTIQDKFNQTQSAGWISGGAFTDNGDGSITVAAGTGMIRATNDTSAELMFFDWAENTNVSAVDESTNYIAVNYDATTPYITSTTTSTANGNTIFNLGLVFREDTVCHLFRAGQIINDIPRRIIERINANGIIQLTSGGIVAETGERYLTVTGANLFGGITKFITGAIDTSDGDTFEYYKIAAGGGFDYIDNEATQINNANYDDGDGTLANLLPNRYRTDWAYLSNDGNLLVKIGTNNDVTLITARSQTPPSSLPPHIAHFSTLVAQIIIKEGQTNIIEINNIAINRFSTSGSVVHNETTGIQGGTTNEYYHLTSAQATVVGNTSGTNSGDVTIGTGNGLSIDGQALSLATADTDTTGALTDTDWDTFNNKQDALVSGTNIKTINSTTLLGSGNIDTPDTTYTAGTGLSLTGTEFSSTITQYTDELAQDAVGTILTDSSEIDFTYTDETPSITASLKSASIDETKLDTSVNASLDLADGSLQLDQTTPQTIINGQPIQNTLTASELVATDGDKKLQSLAVATYPSLTELSYVKGVTSAIQTQLNAKYNPASVACFRAYLNTNTSTANNDIISFNVEEFDIGNNYDGTNKFTAPVNGIYKFGAGIAVSSPTDQERYGVWLRKNNTTDIRVELTSASGTGNLYIDISSLVYLSANDYIQIKAFMQSTKTISNGTATTYFEGNLVYAITI